jgi:hypothetical protein
MFLDNSQTATVDRDGFVTYGDTNVVEEQLVYVVERADGAVETLTPSQFRARLQAKTSENGKTSLPATSINQRPE